MRRGRPTVHAEMPPSRKEDLVKGPWDPAGFQWRSLEHEGGADDPGNRHGRGCGPLPGGLFDEGRCEAQGARVQGSKRLPRPQPRGPCVGPVRLGRRGLAELRLGPRGSADHQGGGSQRRAAGRGVQRPVRRLRERTEIGGRETSMDLGMIAGWASVILGQLVSWPQVLKLRRERGDGVSLASYAIVNVSMTLFFLHAIGIGDTVSMVSVPVSMVPNVLIATTLLRRRRCLSANVPASTAISRS